jgi:hypothetical protein
VNKKLILAAAITLLGNSAFAGVDINSTEDMQSKKALMRAVEELRRDFGVKPQNIDKDLRPFIASKEYQYRLGQPGEHSGPWVVYDEAENMDDYVESFSEEIAEEVERLMDNKSSNMG